MPGGESILRAGIHRFNNTFGFSFFPIFIVFIHVHILTIIIILFLLLFALRGWRPLAADPHAEPGAQVSRDHVISTNPKTDVTFIAGGKWTTWREMAEDALDKVLGKDHPKCNTLDIVLHGGEGYSENLSIQLIQKYGLREYDR